MLSFNLRLLTVAALAAVLASSSAHAVTHTIDADDGAVYDGIMDGFFFPGGLDGVGDGGGNAPSVALKSNGEMRTVAEFPLDAIAGVSSGDIVSAHFVFNIDDVIGTFGPGAAFDGTAAENIFIWAWAGDGDIDLTDFANVTGPPSGSVNTGPHGSITDTTLTTTGPLEFSIDITARVQTLVGMSVTDLGITVATNDPNSATSIDDLGAGGTGPAGVNGSALPKLVIVVTEPAPPTFDDDELKCQKEIAKQSQALTVTTQKLLTACFNKVLKALSQSEPLTEATTYCEERLDLSTVESKMSKTQAKAGAKIPDKCEGLTPASVNSPCDAAATTFADTAACIIEEASANAESSVRSAYRNACAILTAVGLESAYPTVCSGS